MLWKDIPQMSQSRVVCRDMNLENELNKLEMLEEIYSKTLKEIGITSDQSISSDILIDKLGEMILRYAEIGKIDSKKTLALIASHHEREARLILGRTAVCLLEHYGLILGGPKIP